ncbi:hypothetical protein BU15DRAFT_44273, partial [Melanogaster broomeanus]
ITEFATLVFSPPHNPSDPTFRSLFQKLSTWQSACSGFPLLFFTNPDGPSEIHLITGWDSVEAHEAWIKGDQNQELLRLFAPYIDPPKMVHLDIDFESIPEGLETVVIERYSEGSIGTRHGEQGLFKRTAWSQVGRDLGGNFDSRGVYHFTSGSEEVTGGEGGSGALTARWKLRRVKHD